MQANKVLFSKLTSIYAYIFVYVYTWIYRYTERERVSEGCSVLTQELLARGGQLLGGHGLHVAC